MTAPAEIVRADEHVPAASPAAFVRRLKETMTAMQEAKDALLQNGIDYGDIPGGDKPTLLQPGAELLMRMFNYGFRYEIEHRVEDWETPFFRYSVRGIIVDAAGSIVGEGPGEANSNEPRYKRLQCPKCESGVWDNRRQKAQDKFLDSPNFACKNKGCDFTAQKPSEVPQVFDFSLVNTLMKMAVKRAKVAAVLTATGGSHFFTQDVEDLPEDVRATVDAPAKTSRGSQGGSEASQPNLVCPACGSKVWDNREKIASGQFSNKSPRFACSNKDGDNPCTGVTPDGELVTDGEAGKPWVTWHEHYFDPKPESAGAETQELKEILGHIETGAIKKQQVLPMARRIAREAGEEEPTSFDSIGTLSEASQVALAVAVAEKISVDA